MAGQQSLTQSAEHGPPYFCLNVGEPPPRHDYGLLRCSGPRLIFSAWHDGESAALYVSRDGRIRRIIPAY